MSKCNSESGWCWKGTESLPAEPEVLLQTVAAVLDEKKGEALAW